MCPSLPQKKEEYEHGKEPHGFTAFPTLRIPATASHTQILQS